MREKIWSFLGKSGIWKLMIFLGIDCFLFRINCKERIEKDRLYFFENEKKIEKVLEILADDLSKKHYMDAWKFRLSFKKKDRPLKLKSPYLNNQYFVREIFSLSTKEVFVDAGAFNGDTYEQFVKATNDLFDKYIAYEPDSGNYRILREKTQMDSRVVICQKGLWDSVAKMSFNAGNFSKSSLNEMSNEGDVEVLSLDTDLECQNASFIKMDIEGAELKALIGSKELIKKNRPKLAICIYHSCEDMIDIILYIHKLVPQYKIYVRHHSLLDTETVMYAVI